MSKYRDIVYMVLDELKIHSDDASFTEEHILFLINKYRAFILKQRYSDKRKEVPQSNYQTLCLDLKQVEAIDGEPCTGGYYLRSVNKIPDIIPIGASHVYPTDFYQGHITLVNKERMKYVGHNKFLGNIIYCSIGPDNYLYFKSNNPQHMYLEKVKFTGIFEDAEKASQYACDNDANGYCDVLDRNFPLEEALTSVVIQLTVKELLPAEYQPEDTRNDDKDNNSGLTVKS